MIEIGISYGDTAVRFSGVWVRHVLRSVLVSEGFKQKVELGVRFVDDREMQKLNRIYRKKNKPTDVLSFSYESKGSGDIVINVDDARRFAQKDGHVLKKQVGMLLIHGVLHICGFDHVSLRGRSRMWKKQDVYSRTQNVFRIAFDDFG